MRKLAFCSVVAHCALALCLLLAGSVLIRAQEQNRPAQAAAPAPTGRDEINYDAQLYLLIATSEAETRASYPPALEAAVRQLRASLPFAGYRLAGTLLYRVKDNGSLEIGGVGNFALAPANAAPTAPTFYGFTIGRLRQSADVGGQPLINVERLRFTMRLPIVTGTTRAEGSSQGFPVVNYENVGITTEISLREATPTIIGTLTTSRPDEFIVLALTVRRAATR